MPGIPTPSAGPDAFLALLRGLESRIRALETQQTLVFTDPTGSSGDPFHGHAVVVMGNLAPITGIAAFGIASHKTGSWVQL